LLENFRAYQNSVIFYHATRGTNLQILQKPEFITRNSQDLRGCLPACPLDRPEPYPNQLCYFTKSGVAEKLHMI
jgi:hypothetical protein